MEKTTSKQKVMLQTNEEVLTDSLHMTCITTPEAYQLETRSTSNTRSLLLNSKRKTEHQGHKIKTTLRIYFLEKANTEPITQDLFSPNYSIQIQSPRERY